MDPDEARYYVLAVTDDVETRYRLEGDLKSLVPDAFELEILSNQNLALDRIKTLRAPQGRVPLVVFDQIAVESDGRQFIREIESAESPCQTSFIRLTSRPFLDEQDRLLDTDSPSRSLGKPWVTEVLADCVRDMLLFHLANYAPDDLDRFSEWVGVAASAPMVLEGGAPGADRVHTFLSDRSLTDFQALDAMIREIDATLGNPKRRDLEPGEELFQEGQALGSLYVLESGKVRLTRRAGERAILFHSHSAGRILGLLALTQNRRSFFTCHAVSRVRVIPLTLSQLNEAFDRNSNLTAHFLTVLVRSLAGRNRRVAELQIELEGLNAALRNERDELSKALRLLAAAQGRIIESDRMATLGKLAAGVAHELNNPIAAIGRSSGHLVEDLVRLFEEEIEETAPIIALRKGIESEPLSTREERQIRKEFSALTGEEDLARNLVRVGLRNRSEAEAFLRSHPPSHREDALNRMDRFHRVGTSLRSLKSCSARVADLVRGLKSYARWDQGEIIRGDLHRGIQDTLLIFSHELRRIEVERLFGDLPEVECQMGRMNQVWTNLIANAIQAMEGEGRLTIETQQVDRERVRVAITDSGPGIPTEHLDRLLEQRFTTKSGEKDFGMGIGLTLCREIVEAQAGEIRFDSEPGRTTVTVTLPISRPSEGAGEA